MSDPNLIATQSFKEKKAKSLEGIQQASQQYNTTQQQNEQDYAINAQLAPGIQSNQAEKKGNQSIPAASEMEYRMALIDDDTENGEEEIYNWKNAQEAHMPELHGDQGAGNVPEMRDPDEKVDAQYAPVLAESPVASDGTSGHDLVLDIEDVDDMNDSVIMHVSSDDDDGTNPSWLSALGVLTSLKSSSTQGVWNANDLFPSTFHTFIESTDTIYDKDIADLSSNIEAAWSARHTTQFKTKSAALITRLLDLDTPKVDDKLIDFLMLEDVMEIFMTHLHRLPEDVDPSDIPRTPLELFRVAHREVDPDIAYQKRSYNAMELLCSGTSVINRLYSTKSDIITSHLFYMLHPKSKGNFNHFRRIVEYSTQFHAEYRERVMIEPVKEGLGSKTIYPILYWAFAWVHETPVANALFPILFSASSRTSSGLYRKDIFETLSTADWLELLVSMMTDEEASSEHVAGASDFFCRCVETAADTSDSEVLFQELRTKPYLLKGMIAMANSKKDSSGARREPIIEAIDTLLFKSVIKSSTLNQGLSDPMAGKYLCGVIDVVRKELHYSLKDLIEALNLPFHSKVLNRDIQYIQLPSHRVEHPMTVHKILLLNIVTEVIGLRPSPAHIQLIPANTWKSLVDQFFIFIHNNAYHAAFSKLVYAALSSNDETTLKIMLFDTLLIEKMISHYIDTNGKTGLRGYIILICNYIRLSADTRQMMDFLPNALHDNSKWREFLHTLRTATTHQIHADIKFAIPDHPLPNPHFGPSDQEAISLPEDFAELDTEGDDLGSKYATVLGFPSTSDRHSSVTARSTSPTAHSSGASSCTEPSSPRSSVATGAGSPTISAKTRRNQKKRMRRKAKRKSDTSSPQSPILDSSASPTFLPSVHIPSPHLAASPTLSSSPSDTDSPPSFDPPISQLSRMSI